MFVGKELGGMGSCEEVCFGKETLEGQKFRISFGRGASAAVPGANLA